MKHRVVITAPLLTAGFVFFSCSSGSNGTGATSGMGGSASVSSSSGSTSSGMAGAGGSMAPPGPDPACLVDDVTSMNTTIAVKPTPLTTADVPTIVVTDLQTGHTNVGVRLCTPNGPVAASLGAVDSGQPPFAWHWTAPSLPLGTTQVIFEADPNATVYRTMRIDVQQGGTIEDAGSDAPADGPPGPTDLCNPPPGNLLAHTTFEEGMNGFAPTFWQVRDPSIPNGACLGSGSPDQHVFLTAGAPGCGGNALAVDARGQWDCYAVQIFSDYNTIQEGATYRISATARSQGNAVNPAAWFHLGAQWLDANDAVFGDVKNPKFASGDLNDYDWKVLWWDVVAPSGARRVVVWLSAHYPGRVDFDNVSVVKLN